MTNAEDDFRRVAILGVGLLGGSVALALKQRLNDVEIVGLSRSEAKRQLAIQCGAVDVAVDNIAAACEGADVVVVAAPVDRIASMANEAYASAPDGCLITDVGSTKATITDRVPHKNFVAAHPIAGSEKTGVTNAWADLFVDKTIVITPTTSTDPAMLEACDRFWQLTGGRTVRMSPEDHDAHLAAVSHVPHLMSALVARQLPPSAKELVGTGWQDITRVAAGDPDMWTAICGENQNAIISELDRLMADLKEFRQRIAANDQQAIEQWLTEAKQIKESAPQPIDVSN